MKHGAGILAIGIFCGLFLGLQATSTLRLLQVGIERIAASAGGIAEGPRISYHPNAANSAWRRFVLEH